MFRLSTSFVENLYIAWFPVLPPCEIVEKEKEMHARLTFSLQTVKDTAIVHG